MTKTISKIFIITLNLIVFFTIKPAVMAQSVGESNPDLGLKCPAGPWVSFDDYYYNECWRGEMCNLGDQYYSIGDFIYDSALGFMAVRKEEEEPYNPKIIPHPYFEEYKDFTCKMDDCVSGVTSTSYCVSEIDGEIPAIRVCTAITLPHCNLADVYSGASGNIYCDIGTIRDGDPQVYCPGGTWMCTSSGWTCADGSPEAGDCWPHPHPTRICFDGEFNFLRTDLSRTPGQWVDVPRDTPEQGRCEEMLTDLDKLSFTPGYVRTYTSYLFEIWRDTVKRQQAIFTPFRTELEKGIADWPGETFFEYSYTDEYAEAGQPPYPNPGSSAKVYFRYLGFIHCAKENLLHKLTSLANVEHPYIYYDARCNNQIW